MIAVQTVTTRKIAANLSLRATTLASRFLFIFFLAKFVDPATVGLYGLFAVTVGYALYLLGLDFYVHSTREILKRGKTDWGAPLKNQLALSAVLYAILMPLLGILFAKFLPVELMPWFFVILVLEHVSQELGRLLVAMSEQLTASLVTFVRQGSWAILMVALMSFDPSTRSLGYVFGAWATFGLLSCLLGFYRLRRLRLGGWKQPVDWRWIRAGLGVCMPFLLATLALRGLQTLDRYWVEVLSGIEAVGAYVLFMGVASTLLAFLESGVFAFAYPKLISLFQAGDSVGFRTHLRRMTKHTIVVSTAFSLASLLMLPPLLSWIGNPFYVEHRQIFPWLLLAMVINALGMIPHYALYAQGKDRPIIFSHMTSIAVFLASAFALSHWWPLIAIPAGLAAAFAFILYWKSRAFFDLTPRVFIYKAAEGATEAQS